MKYCRTHLGRDFHRACTGKIGFAGRHDCVVCCRWCCTGVGSSQKGCGGRWWRGGGSGWGRTSRPAVYISLTWRTPGRVTWGESSALIGALRPRRSDDDTRRGRRVWARRSTIG